MHTPVLLKKVIECLKIQKDGVYLDLTVGYGFHAKAILEKAPEGFLVGIDKDGEALKHAEENLKKIGSNFKLIQGDFRAIDQLLVDSEHQKFDGVLGDLGVSSPQIDKPNRGFSYSKTGPLDMRMDQRQRLSAEWVVNQMDEKELSEIFENYAWRGSGKPLSKAIVSARPILTTTRLVEVIKKALPSYLLRKKNPAKVVFQAIRIFVNDELKALEEMLEKIEDFTAPKATLALITFHSLEDKVVKKLFASKVAIGDNYRQVEPTKCIYTTKAFWASEEEVLHNPRAKSAKLRVLWINREENERN